MRRWAKCYYAPKYQEQPEQGIEKISTGVQHCNQSGRSNARHKHIGLFAISLKERPSSDVRADFQKAYRLDVNWMV